MPPKSNQKTYKECTKIEKNNTNRDINILSHILNYKYTFYTTAAINYQFAGCEKNTKLSVLLLKFQFFYKLQIFSIKLYNIMYFF